MFQSTIDTFKHAHPPCHFSLMIAISFRSGSTEGNPPPGAQPGCDRMCPLWRCAAPECPGRQLRHSQVSVMVTTGCCNQRLKIWPIFFHDSLSDVSLLEVESGLSCQHLSHLLELAEGISMLRVNLENANFQPHFVVQQFGK